jgi:hypothetical protein
MKKRFASGAEKRAVKRHFQEAGAQQWGALDSFVQKREDMSSENMQTVEEQEVVEMDSNTAEIDVTP